MSRLPGRYRAVVEFQETVLLSPSNKISKITRLGEVFVGTMGSAARVGVAINNRCQFHNHPESLSRIGS